MLLVEVGAAFFTVGTLKPYGKEKDVMRPLLRARPRFFISAAVSSVSVFLALIPAGVAAADASNIPCGDNAALVHAINTANSAGRPTTINLGSGSERCAYVLTAPAVPGGHNGLPVVTGDITINGGGAIIARGAALGTPNFRLFEVGIPDASTTVPNGKLAHLTLNHVTIKGGKIDGIQDGSESFQGGDSGYGGGILVKKKNNSTGSSLVLNNSVITGNSSSNGHRVAASLEEGTKGGGIAGSVASITINNSVISDNTTSDSLGGFSAGGGIANSDGVLLVHNSVIANNHSISNGFPIGAYAGAVESDSRVFFHTVSTTIEGSVISGNTVSGIATVGAAIDSQRELTITRTSITSNTAASTGDNSPHGACIPGFFVTACNAGSAYAESTIVNQGHAVITDSLITGNKATATGSPHALVEGAGIMNSGGFSNKSIAAFLAVPGLAEITRTTIAGNIAEAKGNGAETRGAGVVNADGHISSNLGGGQGGLTLTASVVTGNLSASPNAHGGGIDNYVRPMLEHPEEGRSLGTVTLNNTIVLGNRPHNCEQQTRTIAGCSG